MLVHNGGVPTAAGEAVNPADVVHAATGAPSKSIVALLDGGTPTAAEAKGEAVSVHDTGAPTTAGEAVNPVEVVNAAAGAREAGAQKATAITMAGPPGCLCLLYGIGVLTMVLGRWGPTATMILRPKSRTQKQ